MISYLNHTLTLSVVHWNSVSFGIDGFYMLGIRDFYCKNHCKQLMEQVSLVMGCDTFCETCCDVTIRIHSFTEHVDR